MNFKKFGIIVFFVGLVVFGFGMEKARGCFNWCSIHCGHKIGECKGGNASNVDKFAGTWDCSKINIADPNLALRTVHCDLSVFVDSCGEWTSCSEPCDGGIQTRICTRMITFTNENLGNITESRVCNTQACVYSCTGSISSNSNLCSGDSSGLTADTTRTLQSSCTSNRKCEYTCRSGYHKSGSSCVRDAVNYSCTGSIPSNSNLCSGDSSGLTADTTRTLQSSCTSNRKCEYTCRSGYHKSGTQCVENSAVVPEVFNCLNYGDPIVHATICPGADLNIASPTVERTVDSCNDWQKCTYLCDLGYVPNVFGNNCIANPSACSPSCGDPATHCSGVSYSDGCSGTCWGTKTCPGVSFGIPALSCLPGNVSRKITPRYSYECLNGNCNETITYISSNESCGSRTCEDDGNEVEFCDGNATNTKKVGVKDSCTNSGCEQSTETCAIGQPQDCEVGEVCRMNAGHAECVPKTSRWIEE